jgi:ABC-type sugar transport system substrate-binding protein
LFDWEWVYCDAEGTVDGMQTCADSLIDQGVDAIITDGTTVEVIVDQLDRAMEEGIPFVNTGGTQSFYDHYAASFNPDDAGLGKLLADWIVENGPGGGEIIVSSVGYTAWGGAREASLASAVEGTGYVLGDTHDVDFADPIGQPADAVATALTATPDAAVVWLTFDIAALGVGPVITDLYPDLVPPDRPLVATFYANCTTQQQMHAGGVDVSVEENLEWGSWVAVDQIAAFFASGTPFSTELRPTYTDADGNELQFSQPFIVTPDTAPESCEPVVGPYPTPEDAGAASFREFFRQKWADQYGIG